MTDKKKRFNLSVFLAGVALGGNRAKNHAVTVRACYAPPNTCALPRRNPENDL